MTIYNRIKALRIKNGISQTDLAVEVGYSGRSAISKIENGERDLSTEMVIKFAKALHTSPQYLFTGEDDEEKENNTFVEFEEIGSVRAGYGGTAIEEYTGNKVMVSPDMLHGKQADDFFILRVKGNSMYPMILNGDQILCERTDSVDSGEIAVIMYDGEDATVKRVNYVSGEDWLELVPINPEYQTKKIKGKDLENCKVIGRVKNLMRKF